MEIKDASLQRRSFATLALLAAVGCSSGSVDSFPKESTAVARSSLIEPPQLAETDFSDAAGWNQPQYYSTIRFPDLNRDTHSDVCGRGSAGIYCALDDTTGAFLAGQTWNSFFSDAGSWNQAKFYATIAFPDLNKDGRADVCGRFSDGIHCALSDGAHFKTRAGSTSGADLWTASFGSGWDAVQYYSTIRFPDVNGDGFPDVCGRFSDGVHCALNNQAGAFINEKVWNSTLTDSNGFALPQYYQTIGFTNVGGSASADLCVRGRAGIYCAISNGVDGFYTQAGTNANMDLWVNKFDDASGWDQEAYYSSIGYPIITSSGLAGVCARAVTGIWCSTSTGSSFNQPTKWLAAFTDDDLTNNGLSVTPDFYRTIKFPPNLGDPTLSTGHPSLSGACGRWAGGLVCARNTDPPNQTSAGFDYPFPVSPEEADPSWAGAQYYSTITFTPDLKVCERAAAGIRCSAGSPPGDMFPFLYGSSQANNSSNGGYNGPNPTFQGEGYFAMHFSTRQNTGCQPPSCVPGPMQSDPSLVDQVRWKPVLWNSTAQGCTGNGLTTVKSADALNFANVVQGSAYYAWIAREYGLPQLSVSAPVTVSFSPNDCNAPISRDFIEQKLIDSINAGTFGTVNPAATIFGVHLAPNVNLSSVLSGICGENVVSGRTIGGVPIHYYLIPDPTTGCSNWTVIESHELNELLTDPYNNNAGWKNRVSRSCASYGCFDLLGADQIADGCNATQRQISGGSGTTPVTVQGIWSNSGNGCMIERAGTPGDVSRSGAASIVLAGTGSNNVAAAIAAGSGNRTSTFSFSSPTMDQSSLWKSIEAAPGAKFVAGDFDGDGLSDAAATGPAGWATIPVRFARSSGSYLVKNFGTIRYPGPINLKLDSTLNFPLIASQNPLGPVSGDFNGDGLSDIAFVGYQQGWTTIPIAFSSGDGHFWPANAPESVFNGVVNQNGSRPRLVSADFNGDGLADIAALGLKVNATTQTFIAVALSNGDGTFTETNVSTSYSTGGPVADVNNWALDPTVQIVTGDFNGDGLGDIALQRCGATGWGSIPVVFGSGGQLGTSVHTPGKLTAFVITNTGAGSNATFASVFSAQAGTKLAAGDFDGDGSTDLALTGPAGWSSVPIAFSTSIRSTSLANLGVFTAVNDGIASFPALAAGSGVVPLSGSQAR